MAESKTRGGAGLMKKLTDRVGDLTSGRHKERALQAEQQVAQLAAELARASVNIRAQEGTIKGLQADLARLQRELEDAQLMLMGKQAEFKNELTDAHERNAELLDRVVALTQRDRELQAKILDAKFEGSSSKSELQKLDMELRDLRRSTKAKEARIAELTAQLEALGLELGAKAQTSAEAQGTSEVDPAAWQALQERLQKSLEELAELTRERDTQRTRLKDMDRELRAVSRQLEEARPPITTDHASASPEPAAPDLPSPTESTVTLHASPMGDIATGTPGEILREVAAGKRPATARLSATKRLHRATLARRQLEEIRQRGGPVKLPEALAGQFALQAQTAEKQGAASTSGEPGDPRSGRSRRTRSRSRRPQHQR